MKSFYEILGVPRDSDIKAIKSAYRKIVKLNHPDVNGKTGNVKKLQDISAAYAVLSKPEKKKLYDASLAPKKNYQKQEKNILSEMDFKFREFKKWLLSAPYIEYFFRGRKLSKPDDVVLKAASINADELIRRIIYSTNIYVKLNAVRALFIQKKHYIVSDLIRILYSNIDETVKIEIIKGLSSYHENGVREALKEIYNVERSPGIRKVIKEYSS